MFNNIPRHHEDEFIDFDRERMMLQMLSTDNPFIAKGDVNKDGLNDFYFGSSKREAAAIYIKGWCSSLAVSDVDGNGRPDIVAGNLGLNSKLKASRKKPLRSYIKDFDENGTRECVTSVYKIRWNILCF